MINPDKLQSFLYWIEERESIRTKKESGASAPWTEDKLLATYRFCNVRRQDDRVSSWLVKNVYDLYKHNDNLWFMAACARWINWPPTIVELVMKDVWPSAEFSPTAFGEVVDQRVRRGEKGWTSAYLITARTLPKGQGKADYIANSTLLPLWEKREKFREYLAGEPTVEGAMDLFHGCFGFGSFMAGQVVADWSYTDLLSGAKDLYTYAPVGPGSARGMNKLHDREQNKVLHQEQFTEELLELMPHIPITITAHDAQSCLCEWDKYTRLQNGGQVRSKYTPEARF